MSSISKHIKKTVRNYIRQGKSKQEVFETILANYDVLMLPLARYIRFIASPAAKRKYAVLNYILIIILLITSTIKFFYIYKTFPDHLALKDVPIFFIIMIGISSIDLIMAILVALWLPWAHLYTALLTFLQALWLVNYMIFSSLNIPLIIEESLSFAIINLSIYIHQKVFPRYKTVPEHYINVYGKKKVLYRIVFEE